MNKREFLLFLLTGCIAALSNFLSRIIFDLWFSFELSVILAYIIGLITAYTLARKYVFHAQSVNVITSGLKFIVVNMIAVIQIYFISIYLFYWLENVFTFDYNKELAHFIGISSPVITSYIGHKYFSFK